MLSTLLYVQGDLVGKFLKHYFNSSPLSDKPFFFKSRFFKYVKFDFPTRFLTIMNLKINFPPLSVTTGHF